MFDSSLHLSTLGIIFALIGYAISMTPSLLPRRWWWQGFVSGPMVALGYSLGWGLTNVVSYVSERFEVTIHAPAHFFHRVSLVLIGLTLLGTIWSTARSYIASRHAARLVEVSPSGLGEYLLSLVATAFMFLVSMGLVYLLTVIFVQIIHLFEQWVPFTAAWLIAVGVAVAVIFIVSNKVVFKLVMLYFARIARGINDRANSHLQPPVAPERSGSPDSNSSWASVGGQGRLFLGHGPSAEDIAAVTGRPAMTPVRVYVGLPEGKVNMRDIADKAVEELRRTGGFDRAVLVVYTATGSGWVDEWVCQPLEFLTGGDCAIVSIQYSSLFSAAMLVSDMTPCEEAGTALFEAVEEEVQKLPEDKRPLLVVAGESLGAHGSQAPFVSVEDLNNRVDAALWIGSPAEAPLSGMLTKNRQKGSPQVSPVIDSGRNIRFVNDPSQLEADIFGREYGKWDFPRTAFVQHASDPVALYTPKLAFSEPDWLRERAGKDVSPSIRFSMVNTLLQTIADLPVSGLAPAGHGHTYHEELLEVWTKLLALDEEVALGSVANGDWITPQMKEDIVAWVKKDLSHYFKGVAEPPVNN